MFCGLAGLMIAISVTADCVGTQFLKASNKMIYVN